MRIIREELLRQLESVSPGLAAREVVDQATCFVFDGGYVTTFNDEMACSTPCAPGLAGAVPAQRLLDLLRKLTEEGLDVSVQNGELMIKGVGRRSGIRLEAEITMPLSTLEKPTDWTPLDPDTLSGIEMAAQCAAAETDNFLLKCIHITPDFIEATDNYKAIKYNCKTGVDSSVLVNHTAGRHLVGCGMTEVCQTENWLHFRNPNGLTISCRQHKETYADLEAWYGLEGEPARLPLGINEAVAKAAIFSDDQEVTFYLRPGKMRVKAQNMDGWFEEQREVQYDGPVVSFMLSPKLVEAILKHGQDIQICTGAIKVQQTAFTFITSSKAVEEAAAPAAPPPAAEKPVSAKKKQTSEPTYFEPEELPF